MKPAALLLGIGLTLQYAEAQTAPEPISLGSVTLSGSIRSRVESWRWFTPESGDPGYTFVGNQLRLNFARAGQRLDWMFDIESPILLGLPDNAVAPGAQGQLGMGANYFVANHQNRNVAMLFPKQAYIRFKDLFGSEQSSLRIGRFEFQDGSEVTSENSTISVVKRDRVHQRLIGPFVFTHVMRSFDGLHFIHDNRRMNYTVVAALPTRGVFQVDGWGWMKTAFAYASVTRQVKRDKNNRGEWRLFGIYYHDWRSVLKQDNRLTPVRAGDTGNIRVGTYGGHYVHVTETGAGPLDFLLLGAGQFGKWGTQDHRAGFLDFEAGIQPKILPKLKPWLRAGYSLGTGDGDPDDTRHGTFLQILPTARPFARFPFFNMMNNEDRFAMLSVRPHKQVVFKSEVHALRLAKRNDAWYLGGGAFQPWTFGYQSRSAGGSRSLANLYDLSIDITPNPHVAFTIYYGFAQGKSVIESIYPRGKNGHMGYVELSYRF